MTPTFLARFFRARLTSRMLSGESEFCETVDVSCSGNKLVFFPRAAEGYCTLRGSDARVNCGGTFKNPASRGRERKVLLRALARFVVFVARVVRLVGLASASCWSYASWCARHVSSSSSPLAAESSRTRRIRPASC